MGLGKEIAKGVLIGVIGEVIVIILSFLANHLGIIDLMTVQLPVWIFLAIIIILVPAAVMASRVRRPSERIILTAHSRPNHIIGEFTAEQFGVKWRVLYGSFLPSSEPYAFCKSHPHCPRCDYEMTAKKKGLLKRYYWKCVPCNKYYKVPQKTPHEASDIVEKLLEAEIRTGRQSLD